MSSDADSSIRQATIADTDRIWDFIKIAYRDTYPYMIPERWRWQYLLNPFRRRAKDELPIWLAEREDRIVGQIATIPAEFIFDDQKVFGVWGVDLIVLPEYRSQGLGQHLIQEVVRANGFYLAVEMSPVTKRIYDRLGYVPLNPVSLYAKIIKLDRRTLSDSISILAGRDPRLSKIHVQLSKFAPCYATAACVLNLCFHTRALCSVKPKRRQEVQIEEMDGFGQWTDALVKSVQGGLGNMVARDRAFLNWRFKNNPQLNYKVFAAYLGKRIVGYSVLRRSEPVEQNFGFIVDILAPPERPVVLEEILRHAIAYFGHEVAGLLCAWPLARFRDSFKKFGFFETRKSIPYAYCTDSALLDKVKASRDNWYITKGDSDWDQIIPVARFRPG